MKNILSILILFTLLISCENEKRFTENILEDIRTGKISYKNTLDGKLLYDPELRLNSILQEHIKAQDWVKLSDEEKIDLPTNLFTIPQDIETFEFVSEWSNDFNQLKIEVFDQENYLADEYQKVIYDTYEDFKNGIISNPNQYQNFEINEELQRVRYTIPIQEKRYSYRINSNTGSDIYTFCTYTTSDKTVLGAIFKGDN